MNVKIVELIEGADQAKGLAVIIDVFRAFSLEVYLMARGAKEILAVGKEETARRLKKEHEDYVLIGERGGVILPGFDFGNSPSQTKNMDFHEKTVIHTTSAGTQGLVHASQAHILLPGSLINAKAIANYIQDLKPEDVYLVAMGLQGKERAAEDFLCARYLRSLILSEDFDIEKELTLLRNDSQAKKFFCPETQHVFPKEDYVMCVAYNQFDFALKANRLEEDVFRVTKIKI